ncbi:hypothetical protein LIER_25198 [Lithospermum erythrorhizon]|uniref:Leucine-rich repeat-containing N-terminal plant-type domain-containing protein n=1 Tax=Lithospermum erythrorhizon TaxID=34254 RepID=A0AAV3R854_LITER
MSNNKKVSVLLVAFVINLLSNSSIIRKINGETQYKLSSIDLIALREIKNSLTEIPTSSTSEFFGSWDFNTPEPCSTFAGIICTSTTNPIRRVISLTLGTGLSESPGLAGSLSPSISKLTQLTQLVLFTGIVTGPIPPLLGTLKKLRVISLTHNRLTGPIPPSICSLPELHTLDLSSNLLTGPIPDCLSRLRELRVMVLASNRLTGQLPGQLPGGLLHLDLKTNALSGILPNQMPSSLRYLSASGNYLTGPLNGLQSLSQLVYLDLSMNLFSGPIPSSLFHPCSLTTMLLQRNNLTGGVPSPPSCYYPSGSSIDLSHNTLTGELNSIFAGVESLFLNNNQFRGVVPKEYAASLAKGTTTTLYLQHNYFTGFSLDSGVAFPDSISLCLSYNCFQPLQLGFAACPSSAGQQLTRPAFQCSAFNHV